MGTNDMVVLVHARPGRGRSGERSEKAAVRTVDRQKLEVMGRLGETHGPWSPGGPSGPGRPRCPSSPEDAVGSHNISDWYSIPFEIAIIDPIAKSLAVIAIDETRLARSLEHCDRRCEIDSVPSKIHYILSLIRNRYITIWNSYHCTELLRNLEVQLAPVALSFLVCQCVRSGLGHHEALH
jgi:hypothetical protein